MPETGCFALRLRVPVCCDLVSLKSMRRVVRTVPVFVLVSEFPVWSWTLLWRFLPHIFQLRLPFPLSCMWMRIMTLLFLVVISLVDMVQSLQGVLWCGTVGNVGISCVLGNAIKWNGPVCRSPSGCGYFFVFGTGVCLGLSCLGLLLLTGTPLFRICLCCINLACISAIVSNGCISFE